MRVFISVCLINVVAANFLRRGSPAPEELHVSVLELQSDLLQEIQVSLGESRGLSRIANLEKALHSIYLALDKNENGYLGQAAVRYALHRYFVQRHGWFLKGLEPGASSWNESTPTEILEDRVPSYVLKLFEDRLGARGLSLRELAVLAATFEHLAHDEAVSRLGDVYHSHQMSMELPNAESMVEEAIDTYMMGYVLGTDFHGLNPQRLKQIVHKAYPSWSDTEIFLRDVRFNDAFAMRNSANPFQKGQYTFRDAVRVIESVSDQYGRFQDAECKAMKEVLVSLEDHGTGRVRLSNFYKKAAGGAWQFTESVSALREVGALDETDPSNLRVIIANYISSPSNCLASSNFFTTCCMDECEPILGEIEQKIGAPRAQPHEIMAIASDIDSPTVESPRNLSASLVRRLNEVADSHGGKVPLHGRLFAQWLHHAFPRECPYPQVLNAHNAWMARDRSGEKVAEDQMLMHAEKSSPRIDEHDALLDTTELLPWSDEEILVVQSKRSSKGFGSVGRMLVFFALVISAAMTLVKTVKPALHSAVFNDMVSKPHFVSKDHFV